MKKGFLENVNKKLKLREITAGLLALVIIIVFTILLGNIFNAFSDKDKTETTTSTTTSSTSEDSSSSESTVDSDLPAVSPTDWDLVLVGPFNEIAEEVPDSQLASLGNGYEVDSRIMDSYNQLAEAAEAAGYPLVMVSAFRSVAEQQEVFDSSVNRRMSQDNISEEEATRLTSEEVTKPGFSEHHTGLAIDVVDTNWYNNYTTYAGEILDAAYGNEASAKWLAENAAAYGFIIRYPEGEESITGITYEPWHLRYVGVDSAAYIVENDLTLEEYLELFN